MTVPSAGDFECWLVMDSSDGDYDVQILEGGGTAKPRALTTGGGRHRITWGRDNRLFDWTRDHIFSIHATDGTMRQLTAAGRDEGIAVARRHWHAPLGVQRQVVFTLEHHRRGPASSELPPLDG